MQQSDTISAIATPQGTAGIGIIRISGETAIETAEKIFFPVCGKKLSDMESHRAVYGHIRDFQGELVDEAIALVMRSPHSYTKEDVVELQCHGGTMPLRRTLALTYEAGARPAERGEFTKRAFLNGRLDLSQAQAVMDVIRARTKTSLKVAEGHLSGQFSGRIRNLRHDILEQIAHLEASIDFPEDEVEEVILENVEEKVVDFINILRGMLRTAHAGKILRDGLTAAIIGKPNVGKSSLLNALLREERAIVTDIPGTTRDSIEEYADIGGVPLRIIDTAGIRRTEDAVERIGVERSRSYAEEASLVLAMFDGSRELTAEDEEIMGLVEGREAILLLNKRDLKPAFPPERLQERFPSLMLCPISTKEETGLQELEKAIVQKVYGSNFSGEEGSFVNDERQAEILRQAEKHLEAAQSTIQAGMGVDFVSIDLRSAWEKLGEITGETVGEDIIDQIFSQFCIGK